MTSSKISTVPCRRARGARAFEIAGRGMDRAGVAHGRFHDHAGDIAPGEAPFEAFEVVPGQHLDAVGRLRVLAGAAGDRDRASSGPAAFEAGRRRPQDVVEPAVVMALELQDDAPARRGAGEAEGRLHDLGPEEAKRTRSAQGTISQTSRAASASTSLCPAKRMPRSTCSWTAARTAAGLCPRIIGPMPR